VLYFLVRDILGFVLAEGEVEPAIS